MKIVDLSHEIQYNMTVYSDDERPIFNDISKIKISGYNEKSINICSHTGTHIDSPIHMILFKEGKLIIENLTNLDSLPNEFMFIATPLKFKDSDGCPVRAIGLVE
ncbi:cyclase family protein [Clostridium chauvoei]|uniref:Cyclase family protein n=2 Tax=Clostridium chauvoei TaxID=46867 RepID=A0ABD4RIC2_9CLOT|nr:cyclase family protein [Clostridium chauvoei]ATD54497.1 hypothetical protein BTM20_04305 [Clostridium chauvoei]ATD57820.1 hypothetical protein BTM21_08755 [Clostridium chauvoei]MBX7281045.1 cyclase family protein [Clostridium chauvoei]MBX7283568.1 cyclase family protein [Clostridium chauvoei]MBX7286018.1 cyclase family protein [Clostridium chauvoei]